MTIVIGHEGIARELAVLALSQDPPHALLLAGPEHTGRAELARLYAMLLNCEEAKVGAAPESLPCGSCRPCRLIAERTHPDVITVEPGDVLCKPREGEGSHAKHADSRDIRICQVRGLIELASRFPYEARCRVVIIDPAERLNRDAANTLLKTLEEPPGHTVFVLLSAAPEAIVETILSRCRRIDVSTVERAIIEAGLIDLGISPEIAEQAASHARGRPGVAVTFARQPDLMGDQARLLELCQEIVAGNMRERLRYANELSERWRRDRVSVFREVDAWEMFWEGRLYDAAGANVQEPARTALEALNAVRQARDDLLGQVVPRMALELMLVSFPAATLVAGPQVAREHADV